MRVIAFGAHPDDCDLGAGGVAATYAVLGDKVKSMRGEELAKRRRAEAQEAGRRIGIEYEVLDNHDGKLLPTREVREQVIREIRQWKADIVIAPRPNDYHPDHRYTGVLVQDASVRGDRAGFGDRHAAAQAESGFHLLQRPLHAATTVSG